MTIIVKSYAMKLYVQSVCDAHEGHSGLSLALHAKSVYSQLNSEVPPLLEEPDNLWDSGFVKIQEDGDKVVVSSPNEGSGTAKTLPFGRQHELWRELPHLQRRLREQGKLEEIPNPTRHIALAAVMICEDAAGSILLTRRPKTMRSFPLAWVLPGGMVDDGETLRQTAEREVWEEVGLRVTCTREPVAVWESAYPLSIDHLEAVGGKLKSHVVMVAYVGQVEQVTPTLQLSSQEVDLACWISKTQLKQILENSLDSPINVAACDGGKGGGGEGGEGGGFAKNEQSAAVTMISPEQLMGVYPNDMTDAPEGIGLGHLYILRKYLDMTS